MKIVHATQLGNFAPEYAQVKKSSPLETKNSECEKIPHGVLGAYHGIGFGSRNYEGSVIRQKIKEKATVEEGQITINGESCTAKFYRTKHHTYVIDPNTDKLFKLKFTDDKDRVKQQILASKLYECAGGG